MKVRRKAASRLVAFWPLDCPSVSQAQCVEPRDDVERARFMTGATPLWRMLCLAFRNRLGSRTRFKVDDLSPAIRDHEVRPAVLYLPLFDRLTPSKMTGRIKVPSGAGKIAVEEDVLD